MPFQEAKVIDVANPLARRKRIQASDEQCSRGLPGVGRGPDGHINLKGASNTQSGALVNGANVTDPATGAPAISLPIDVVSSVQVISDPYDRSMASSRELFQRSIPRPAISKASGRLIFGSVAL